MTDRRTRAFHHYSVGGALTVEEEEVRLRSGGRGGSAGGAGHGRSVETVAESLVTD